MRRTESIALRSADFRYAPLVEGLPKIFESLGFRLFSESAGDGQIFVLDHRDHGCVLLVDDATLARRAARALAATIGGSVKLYEVIGTGGEKRFRFRTEALEATKSGELRPAEGKELDLDDLQQNWGGGPLEAQSKRVLEEFAQLEGGAFQTKKFGYKRAAAPRPSTPRVATLVATLKKAKSYEGVPQPGDRVELRIEMATGGKQTSYCSAAEYDELERIVGGGKK